MKTLVSLLRCALLVVLLNLAGWESVFSELCQRVLPGASSAFTPSKAFASPALVTRARKQFDAGDIPAAFSTLEKVLVPSAKVTGPTLETARKLFGVCGYLMGRREIAESMFSLVLAANPQATLNPKDVLDPGIAQVFNSRKARSGPGRGNNSMSSGKGRSTAPKGRGLAIKVRPPPAASGSSLGAKASQSSGVFVKTNAARATVFANGLFVGTSNQEISLDPGPHQITVSAEGFEEAKKSFSLRKGEKLNLNVTLRRPGRVTLAAKPLRAKSAPQGNKGGASGGGFDDLGPAKVPVMKKGGGSLNYDADLPGQKRPQRGRGGQSVADEYFGAGAQQQQQQQGYAQPQYAPPPAQQQQQYAQPQYAQPQYAQPQYAQPQYAQPQYAQPQYAQPAPVIVQPQYVAPPPVVYAAPVQPSYIPPSAADYATAPSQPAPARVKTRPRKKGNLFISLLPLGAGQFQNDDTGKGILFAVGEVGALGLFAQNTFLEQEHSKKYAQYIANTNADPTLRDEKYEAESLSFAKRIRDQKNFSLIGFGLIYALGVIDSVANLNGPDDSGSGQGGKNDPFEDAQLENQRPPSDAQVAHNFRSQPSTSPSWRVQVAPVATLQGGIGLGIKVQF